MSQLKIFNFSSDKFITKVEGLQEQYPLEIVEIEDRVELTPQQVLNSRYDIIEMAPNDYEQFKPLLPAVDWKVSQVGMADTLILRQGVYRPINLTTGTLIELIKKNHKHINSQLPAIVVGELHFVIGVIAQLALNGFVEIIYSLSNHNDAFAEIVQKKIRAFVFDMKLRPVHINELTTSDVNGALFISDFKKTINREAYELLTYFNFLSQGALFIDCNSITDGSLVEDARKAEIAVIDEVEFITQKYRYLQDNLKISPKV